MFSTRASNHVIAGPSYEHANAAARGGGKICRPDTRRVVPRRVTRNLAILGSHASSRNNYAKYGRPETNRGNERSQESWKPTISRSPRPIRFFQRVGKMRETYNVSRHIVRVACRGNASFFLRLFITRVTPHYLFLSR